jgi:hypothetical protein
VDVGDEADAARISLCAWIVEAVLHGDHPLRWAARGPPVGIG